MTKEWTSYAQVTALDPAFSRNDEVVVGLSDEEELRRVGEFYANEGIGEEVFAEVPDPEVFANELRELGLMDDE